MGTRATVHFYSEFNQEKPILSVYHQFDGYIDGVGHDLANWLLTKKIINGIDNETMEAGFANGMGCLAAQYVKENKTRIGGLYLTTSEDLQSYNYHVRLIGGKIEIKVDDIFTGTPKELLEFEQTED